MCKLIFKSSIIEIPAFRFAPAGMTGELLRIMFHQPKLTDKLKENVDVNQNKKTT